MRTIYKYELKRLLLNRFFLGLSAVLLLYCLQLLNTDIIAGVAYTAPFSGWSFGFYFAGILPVLLTALLFLLTFHSSPAELKVNALTCNTPTDPWRHRLIRLAAAGTGCLILCFIVILTGSLFLAGLFGPDVLANQLLPALLTFPPAILFTAGAGMFLGKKHHGILYLLMLLVLILAFLPLPYPADLLGKSFFTEYPLSLHTAEPAFTVPASVAAGKLLYSGLGTALLWLSLRRTGSRQPH